MARQSKKEIKKNFSLFQQGNFRLHSGQVSNFKIDCDFLTDDDLDTLARIATSMLPNYSKVLGIPTGGERFARALEAHCSLVGPVLIADDVYTTGTSLESFRGALEASHETSWKSCLGITIFSRNLTMLPWVKSIFTGVF